ncbi:MAG: alanine racemase [Actinomycetales bacterium]|nr:alanine racemase [Actinomycetales bacterium]
MSGLADPVLGPAHKGVPPALWGRRASELGGAPRLRLSAFLSPVATLDRARADRNTGALLGWARERGFELAPHGKTTMAPELWRRLLDAGAWGLTVATPWQALVAVEAGVRRVLLANELVDPVGAAALAAALDADPGLEIACWVDSDAAVARVAEATGRRPFDVLVEYGEPGGRTGARGLEAARAVARTAAAEPRVRLLGVAGYEGVYAGGRDAAAIARIRSYLDGLAAAATAVLDAGIAEDPLVTAGGSAWFDLVADALAPLAGRAGLVLRSGAFQAHDDGFYAGASPFAADAVGPPLEAALHVRSRVLSRPEPGLALLDAGKRDLGWDLGDPIPVLRVAGATAAPLAGEVTALSDQHAFLRIAPDAALEVGDVVVLGISHPCTTFDRWRVVVEVDDALAPDPAVVGLIATVF